MRILVFSVKIALTVAQCQSAGSFQMWTKNDISGWLIILIIYVVILEFYNEKLRGMNYIHRSLDDLS